MKFLLVPLSRRKLDALDVISIDETVGFRSANIQVEIPASPTAANT